METQVENRTGPCWVDGCHATVELFIHGNKWSGECASCHRTYEMPASRGEIEAFRAVREARQKPRRHMPSRFPCPMPDCQGVMEYESVRMVYETSASDYSDDFAEYVCSSRDCDLTMYLERHTSLLPDWSG